MAQEDSVKGSTSMANEGKFDALIVDDDPMSRDIYNRFLRRNGFVIKMVENGQEAVELFRAGNRFDIVIMDMNMPIMDGIQATKELRTMGVSSLIIGMSAYSFDNKIKSFINAGLDEFYAKPMSMAKVAAIVNCLNKRKNLKST